MSTMCTTTAGVRFLLLLPLLAACHREPKDYGPPPQAGHQELVRAAMDRVFDARYRLEQPSDYRFAAPAQDRVAYWLFEPQQDGRSHQFGYLYGWCVAFHVTPHYRGYPPQPESHRMAFFADGKLRGLFAAASGNAPLDLDKWSADWTDTAWAATRAPGARVTSAAAPR